MTVAPPSRESPESLGSSGEAAETPNAMATRTRSRGKYTRSVDTAERDAEAARLRAQSLSYREIAARMGYRSASSVQEAVQRCLHDTVEEPGDDVRRLELDKLDALERALLGIIGEDRTVVSAGRVTDIPDDGPRLVALAQLLRVSESRRKLLGLDQPAKVTVDGGVRYVLEGVDPEALT